MFNKSSPVGGVHKWDIQHLTILQDLLHSSAQWLRVLLRFNNGNWEVWMPFRVKQIIGSFFLFTCNLVSINDNLPIGKGYFFANLCHDVPTSTLKRRSYVFSTYITFTKFLSTHTHNPLVRCSTISFSQP